MRTSGRLTLVAVLLIGTRALHAAERTTDAPVDFARDVYPILQRACFECHGKENQEGDLRLDQKASVFSGAVIRPGAPEKSELLRRVMLPKSDLEVMPAIGDPLPKAEVAILRRWIAQGAVWPDDVQTAPHWSYVAPTRPDVPDVQHSDWVRNGIDAFVLRKLEEEELSPSPQASPETLIRRVFLDLIGLPPTPEELAAFRADPSPRAYEELVDDLLARPQFGERWATPWLDLARYADSHGFQRDNLRDVWAYRDWVIQAINRDMPFDQFTIEQLAGDLLPEPTEAQKIATGFHRCTPTNVEAGSLPEETRIEQVIDRVNTTASVWLGSTLECAQCHDHKFDPFTQKDYYRLLAYFNQTEPEAERADPKKPSSIAFIGPSMPLADAARDQKRTQLTAELKDVKRRQSERKDELTAGLDTWAAEQAAHASASAQTATLDIIDFESEGTTDTWQKRPDGSVLLVGSDPPSTDVYTIRARVQGRDIQAIRLDTLTDPQLPGKGPGRGDPQRTNFVLNEFKMFRLGSDPDAISTPLSFRSAQSDFSQQRWPVKEAVDGNPRSGWAIAPQFGRSHWALFELEEPLNAADGAEFQFQLIQNFGSARTIGRLKLTAVQGNPDTYLKKQSPDAALLAILQKSPDDWTKQQRQQLVEYRQKDDRLTRNLNQQQTRLEKEIEKLAPETTLVMIERDEQRPSMVFNRGDYRQHGEPVEPGVPDFLLPAKPGPGNRLTLARWLVDPQNPLTARVTVNRLWAELFGQGIVGTPEDFGIKGDRPTHPELLDWLALEFIENGWSRKKILRTIVLSATYQQSSRITPELLARDDQNRLLARGPRFRMSAEMIRDNALAVSGLLSLKQFGPPIRPYQPDGVWSKVGGTNYDYETSPGEDQYRRGLYVVIKRGAPYPSFINFDATARLTCTVQRSRTNTPLQALTLLNDPVYVEAAQALAARVLRRGNPRDVSGRITDAFKICLSRTPQASELAVLQHLYERQLHATGESGEKPITVHKNIEIPKSVSKDEFSAWYAVTSTLLNLHETITKQ